MSPVPAWPSQRSVSDPAVERIVAGPTEQAVIASGAAKAIVTAEAIQSIVAAVTGKTVRSTGASEVFTPFRKKTACRNRTR